MLSRLNVRVMLFFAVAAFGAGACGGDDDGFIDAPRIDAAVDAPDDVDAPVDAPDVDAAIDAPDIDAAVDAPDDVDAPVDAPDVDAAVDAPMTDGAIDAPAIDAPAIDAPAIDAPAIDAPAIDAAIDAPPPIDAAIDAPPPIDAPIDAPPALAGDVCSTATAITLSGGMGTAAATTASYVSDYNLGPCTGWTSNGPDRVHSISAPADVRISASVVPTAATFDPALAVVGGPAASCSASPFVCLAGSDDGVDGETDSVVFNSVGAAQEMFLIVDGWNATGNAYTLNVSTQAITPRDTCSTAGGITLVNGMATVTGTTVNQLNDYETAAACTDWYTDGPDAVHSVSVAAGGTLTVTMTPAAAYDAGVYLVAGPASACTASPACLDGADAGGAGAAEIVTYTNGTAAPVTVFIAVDGDIELSSGDTYSLQVSVTVP